MTEGLLAFLIWLLLGLFFVGMGIYDVSSKKEKAFGFWANAETLPVKDVKAYNRALGRLWCGYGVIFILLGLPLLKEENSAGIILSVLGVMAESIAVMVIYVTVIEKKYRRK